MLIPALLLDLDGVLVFSERLVLEASCSLINHVILQKGVTRQYGAFELQRRFVGLGFTRIVRALGLEHGFEMADDELQRLAAQELDLVVELLKVKVEASPGALEMLAQMHQWGVTCAVVSSSELIRIKACLAKTGLDRYIPKENLFSATDSLSKPEGKPSPAIYNYALRALGRAAKDHLAVEDSVPGVLASVAAGIEVVGYVGAEESADHRVERSRMLIEAGASATFNDWMHFLAWLHPRISKAS